MVSLHFMSVMYIWKTSRDFCFNHIFLFVENVIKHLNFCQENNAFYYYFFFFAAYLMLLELMNSAELQSLVFR